MVRAESEGLKSPASSGTDAKDRGCHRTKLMYWKERKLRHASGAMMVTTVSLRRV